MPAEPSLIAPDVFTRIVREGLPAGAAMAFEVESMEKGSVVLRVTTGPSDVRPGGTIAGPFLFGFADLAMYGAVMSTVGPLVLAVTTDATLHFLRKPSPGVLIARARVLKGGARLVVGEVTIEHASAPGDAVAHAVMTYSVPPAPSSR